MSRGVGYAMHPDHRGKGIMAEAMEAAFSLYTPLIPRP
jgi:RimJ/RimL family protein N-acetyltransferase